MIAQSAGPTSTTTEPAETMMSLMLSSERHQVVPPVDVKETQSRQAALAASALQLAELEYSTGCAT